MIGLLLDLLALLLLAAGLILGSWRWIWPRARSLSLPGLGLMLLLVTTLVGGLLGSPFWWTNQPQSFAWALPPLAARMLAAAAVSFAVASFLVLERPRDRAVRLVLVLLAVYLAPLLVTALLFHRDRFDFRAPITYGFVVIAGGMTLGALVYLLRQPRLMPDLGQPARPGAGARLWLLLVGLITAVWGLALFATDRGPSALVWAWPGDLLTSRLIAVMLLAIAAGCWFSLRDAGTARIMLWMTLSYGLGLAAASLWNVLAGKPLRPAYVVVFGAIALGSALGLALARRWRPATA